MDMNVIEKKSKKGIIIAIVAIVIVCAIVVAVLLLCGGKKPLSIEEFDKMAKEEGYKVEFIEENRLWDGCEGMAIASGDDTGYVYFTVYSNEDEAIKEFKQFKNNKDLMNTDDKVFKESAHYDLYERSSEYGYRRYVRIDNTIMTTGMGARAFVDAKNEDAIKAFMEKLGY